MACFNSSLPNTLNRTCDGSHLHHPIEGSDMLLTPGYTKEICNIIRNFVERDIVSRPSGRPRSGK
eukprot:11138838-Lingulodinium_polyedra.AAC.1